MIDHNQLSKNFLSSIKTKDVQKYDWLGGSLKMRQLGAGQLQSARATWSAGQIELTYETINLKVELTGQPPPGMLVVLIPDVDSSAWINCRQVNDDQVVILCPGNEIRLLNNADQGMLALQVPLSMISAKFKASELLAVGGFGFAHSRTITDSDSVAYFRRLIMNSRFIGANGEWPHVMEQKLADQLKCLISNNTNEWRRRPDRITSKRVNIFKNLAQYLELNSTERISLSELTEIAAVSERTLERMFKKEVGMTPSAYIKAFRLHKAMGELTTCETATKSIAQIAMDHGFEHLGRFSSTYREQYGQTPSMFRQSIVQNVSKRTPIDHGLNSMLSEFG